MSFAGFKKVIEEGDTIILYIHHKSMHAIEVKPQIRNKNNELVENVFQTTYGALKVSSLIGAKFGSKVELSKGWAYVLYPTPELWTITLPHRTQIIYSLDISLIVHHLDISPGSVVIEAGTGSGSLSHSLIRTVLPNGHLYTYDFHATRVATAAAEFEMHRIAHAVTVQQRDVCADGFGSEVDEKADAVFLDLPHPWKAVVHAAKALKQSGGRFCSFSPCIEQAQKTCLMLAQEGFVEISTIECLQREHQVGMRSMNVVRLDTTENEDKEVSQKKQDAIKVLSCKAPHSMPGHTGFMTFATLPPLWTRQLNK